jgi:hypothetical protein
MMIVSFSTIEDLGAGFRSKIFLPRWKIAKEKLQEIEFHRVHAIDARIIIGHVDAGRSVKGIEGPSFVIENRIPIAYFKKLSIREKNDLLLDTIFESIKATYAHFGETLPPEIDHIWHEVWAQP